MPIPTVRRMKFRGSMVWEVDARALAAECKPRKIPQRRKFPTRADADAWVREILRRIAEEPERRIEVRALCESFLESKAVAVRASTLRNYTVTLGRLADWCDRAEVTFTDQLGPTEVGDLEDHLRTDVSPRTAAQYLAVISGCFGWAVDRGYLDHNPFAGKARRRRDTSRRILTDDERETIVTKAERRDLWRFMLATGLRRVEVCRLDEETVVLDSPAPHLRVRGKGGKRRTVELGPETVEVVRRLLAEGSGRIWPHSPDHLNVTWRQERKGLGLPDDITPHVFRHDFASWLVNVEGLPLPDVQRILGHSDLATTAIYLHPDGRRLKAAVRGRSRALVANTAVTAERNLR